MKRSPRRIACARSGAVFGALVLGVVTAGCGALQRADVPAYGPAIATTTPARFVYSPYKYLPVGFDAARGAIASTAGGPATPVVVDGRSTLPAGVGAITLAFATGECGTEAWYGIDPHVVARNIAALERAGIDYIVSTGGQAGTFTCATDAGMERFVARYASSRLVGLDFDIERDQSDAVVASLVQRARYAVARHPGLRISFTLATWAASDGSGAGLNATGERVMRAIRDTGLADYYVNLMVMDYGEATARNCVVAGGVCDMGRSARQAVLSLSARFGVPMHRIELTPMIGVNDVTTNVFTLDDAAMLATFVRESGLGGLHFWSLDRDTPCPAGVVGAQPSCSGVDASPFAFSRAFARALP